MSSNGVIEHVKPAAKKAGKKAGNISDEAIKRFRLAITGEMPKSRWSKFITILKAAIPVAIVGILLGRKNAEH